MRKIYIPKTPNFLIFYFICISRHKSPSHHDLGWRFIAHQKYGKKIEYRPQYTGIFLFWCMYYFGMPWQHRRGFGGRAFKWVAKKSVRRPGSDPPLSSPGLGLAPQRPDRPPKKSAKKIDVRHCRRFSWGPFSKIWTKNAFWGLKRRFWILNLFVIYLFIFD